MNRTSTMSWLWLGLLAAAAAACDGARPMTGGPGDGGTGGARMDGGSMSTDGGSGGGGMPGPDGPRPDGSTTLPDGSTTLPDGSTTLPDGSTRPDGSVPGPVAWTGVYDSTGVWDLSGPITANRTLGDVVSDLLIEEIVNRSGVPSALKGTATTAVSGLVGDKIKNLVDASAPAPLKPGSDLMMKLAVVLASTEVTSTLDLYAGSGAGTVRGTEEVRSFTFGWQSAKTALPVGELLERTVPLVTLGSDWKGRTSGTDTLVIDQHAYELRLGRMILWIVDNVLKEQGAASLSETAASIIDCNAITAALLDGKTELTFGISFVSYSVSASSLTAGCSAVVGVVKTKALGLFDIDAGVELGGDVQYLDDDADAVADRLISKAGYGGIVTKVRASLAPRVAARFQAVRRSGPRPPGGFGPDYADMSNTIGTTARLPIRGRVFRVVEGFDPATTTPFNQISQEELANEPVLVATTGTTPVSLGTINTDGEGYIDQTLDISALALAAGNHALTFTVRGRVAGTASVRLLPATGAPPPVVVRSDVDLTYLDTDFMSTTGKLALLVQRGSERATLPAMELTYRALRRGLSSAEDVPLSYLSGSPNFFKMVLEQKMRIDQIHQDGVVLKPFKDIIAEKVTDVDLAGVVPALEEQVGYKLTALLKLRLDVPVDTREILMGDDSEADAVAYALYHRFTSRQLDTAGLLTAIDAVPVDPTWRAVAADLAPRVAAVLPQTAPVVAIYINLTGKPNARFPVASWTVPQLTYAHSGAWPLALDLYEEGRLSGPAVTAIKARLLDLGRPAAELTAAAQAAVTAGFLKPETVSAFP